MSPESSIAHYRITSKLGEGGMGTVYRATDTKLKRDVAIKVLPDVFAQDPDRLARFTREAQVLASLNHPNIASIYGVEDRALVLELVEGPTLADRIEAGPIPVEDALPIAGQIAEALEYAHDRGIVHRDLKPANIKVTPEGRVKVLDFGLAKALATEGSLANPMSSPTLTMRATAAGAIMGTAGYMSPEQAKGQPADRRADIWAFGVVLAEMLTGHTLYAAATVSETLALVLLKAPNLSELPAELPASVRRLIERCLERDATLRLQHAGEARIVLRHPGDAAPVAAAAPRRRGRLLPVGLALAGLAIGFAAAMMVAGSRPSAPPAALRFQVPLFPRAVWAPIIELSPDGRHIALTAGLDGPQRLWVRSIDTLEVRAVPGTEGARYPAWSPDSAWISFFAEGKLKKVARAGGPAQVLCDAADGRGAAWGPNGTVLFAPTNNGALFRVPASGGAPVAVTRINAAAVREYDRYPSFLAGTDRFLYLHVTASPDQSGVYLGSLSGAAPVRILPDQSNAYYVPDARGGDGWIVFDRAGSVLAQPFDAGSARLTGDPVVLTPRVGVGGNTGKRAFSASATGTLVTWAGNFGGPSRLVWQDRTGRRVATVTEPANIIAYSLSPDEKRIAMRLRTETGDDVWMHEIERSARSRFTFLNNADGKPLWSPDGRFIAFASRPSAILSRLYRKSADGSAGEELLFEQPNQIRTTDWSRDGKYIVVNMDYLTTHLWLLRVGESRSQAGKAEPYLKTTSNTNGGALSPDSRWMVYASDESGEPRIYVQAAPAGGAKWQVSTAGGSYPVWRRDGKEIYFVAGDGQLMAVPVEAGAKFHAGTPQPLFALPGQQYQPSADGRRFLVRVPAEGEATVPPVEVLVNWPATLRKSEPAP